MMLDSFQKDGLQSALGDFHHLRTGQRPKSSPNDSRHRSFFNGFRFIVTRNLHDWRFTKEISGKAKAQKSSPNRPNDLIFLEALADDRLRIIFFARLKGVSGKVRPRHIQGRENLLLQGFSVWLEIHARSFLNWSRVSENQLAWDRRDLIVLSKMSASNKWANPAKINVRATGQP